MMELERKTYDSLDDVVVQDHSWLVKYQGMLVRIDGHDIIVDRIFMHSYESMVSTCVYEAQASGRFGGCECKVLMHADEQHRVGWQTEEKFVDSARRAWFMNHMSEEAKRLEKERSEAIRKRIFEERVNQRGNV